MTSQTAIFSQVERGTYLNICPIPLSKPLSLSFFFLLDLLGSMSWALREEVRDWPPWLPDPTSLHSSSTARETDSISQHMPNRAETNLRNDEWPVSMASWSVTGPSYDRSTAARKLSLQPLARADRPEVTAPSSMEASWTAVCRLSSELDFFRPRVGPTAGNDRKRHCRADSSRKYHVTPDLIIRHQKKRRGLNSNKFW